MFLLLILFYLLLPFKETELFAVAAIACFLNFISPLSTPVVATTFRIEYDICRNSYLKTIFSNVGDICFVPHNLKTKEEGEKKTTNKNKTNPQRKGNSFGSVYFPATIHYYLISDPWIYPWAYLMSHSPWNWIESTRIQSNRTKSCISERVLYLNSQCIDVDKKKIKKSHTQWKIKHKYSELPIVTEEWKFHQTGRFSGFPSSLPVHQNNICSQILIKSYRPFHLSKIKKQMT